MGVKKEETALQENIVKIIKKRRGYVKNNQGGMTTVKGLADLSFCYKGLAIYWEIKTPKDATNVSVEQGIHCRAAQRAGGITAIVTSKAMATRLLNIIDAHLVMIQRMTFPVWFEWLKINKFDEVWDDGTKY